MNTQSEIADQATAEYAEFMKLEADEKESETTREAAEQATWEDAQAAQEADEDVAQIAIEAEIEAAHGVDDDDA